ncbi:Aste57867_802 [Aphanomyces stellatus]|uniref:Aste57867_802 protein n=1 Tax=Aphanomyces stellatus TaxID=120398 RepID=A0A485K7N1_9STRA|nr:hypothetical protein As57867_000801 [Aphanomyces stellatus]VFT78026.1 Aste57867_802 [Aphanomyces stellatus]
MAPIKLPLPASYFCCPPLSSDEINKYRSMGIQSVRDMIDKARLVGGTHSWHLLSTEGDLKIYKTKASDRSDRTIVAAAMATDASLDEVTALYRSDTTEEAKAYARRFDQVLVDASTLYTILPRRHTRPNDFMQIKWMAAKSPIDGLVSKRDFCLLETSLETQIDGHRAWVRTVLSVQLPSVPDLNASHGLVRAWQYGSGQVFVEADHVVHMTYVSDADLGGNGVEWAREQAHKKFVRSLTAIDRYLREDRLSRMPILSHSERCPVAKRLNCYLCRRKFGPLRGKSNCSTCGEVFCNRCNGVWDIYVGGVPLKLRACIACTIQGTKPRVLERQDSRQLKNQTSLGSLSPTASDVFDGLSIVDVHSDDEENEARYSASVVW